MTDIDHEAADQAASEGIARFGWGALTPLGNLARCYLASRAREAELESLFQQHHGVHVSWVAVDAKHRERIARLEALVRSLGKCSWCCGYGYCEEYVSDVETERYQCGRCAGTGLVEAARKELENG